MIRIITGEQNAPASTETPFANDLFSDSPVQSNFDSVGTQFDGAYVPSNPAEVNGAQFAGITGYLYDPQPFSEYFFALKIAVNPDSFAPKYQ